MRHKSTYVCTMRIQIIVYVRRRCSAQMMTLILINITTEAATAVYII